MPQNSTFNTAERIIFTAMENAGLLGEGDTPSSEQIARFTNRLNDIINFIQVRGIKLWAQQTQNITPVLSQATYTLSTAAGYTSGKPLRVIEAYLTDSLGGVTPLVGISWDEYNRLNQKTQTGTPNSYFVDPQANSLNITVWPVPDTNTTTSTFTFIVQRQLNGPIKVTDALDFPQEWFLALSWLLASEISTGQPDSIVGRCEQKAAFYLMEMENWDREQVPTRLVIDQRMVQYGRRFSR